MKKQIWIIAFALVGLLTSCTKQQDTNEELLAGKTEKSWKMTDSYRLIKLKASQKDSVVNEFKNRPDCYKDDFQTYKADHGRYYNQGVVKCDTVAATNRYTGKWEFMNNYKTLNNKTLVGDSDYLDVVELTEDKLVLKYLYTANSTTQDSTFWYLVYTPL
jgi:lipopolysaccharide export LptBFGC system permease protein LptF